MDKASLLDRINDIERKGLVLANRSFECGTHTTKETTVIYRVAEEEFSTAIENLRKLIISEGV